MVGDFFLGAGSQYDGSDLASKGVIIVTINYRLDVFGYLSNGDDVIPGNFGMLDQVRALEWVRRNIQSFGGDPNKVTIFGQSAGSASVSLLVLSPLANGLFGKAIVESGASLSPWSVVQPATGVTPSQIVNLIGTMLGCSNNDISETLECLRNVDAEALLKASINVKNALGAQMHVSPVVENTFGFLPDLPEHLLIQNKFSHVDTIHGFTKGENGYGVLKRGNYTITKKDFIDGLKEVLNPYAILDRDGFIKDMYNEYIGNNTDGHNMLLQLVYVTSDIYFKGPSLVEANIQSTMAPEKNHYVYEFDHRSGGSGFPMWMPAIHGAELSSVFGDSFKLAQMTGWKPSTDDQVVSDEVQNMWTNFAKYGDPTISIPKGAVAWSKYASQDEMVLRITAKSDVVSFANHISQRVIKKLKNLLSTSIPDKYIVG